MEYRHYHGGEEEALVACWNDALPLDQVSLQRFCKTTLLDINFEPEGLIEAWDGGSLQGFVHAVTEPGSGEGHGDGWIPALVVAPSARRRGVATALLERARAFLAARGCGRVLVSPYAPGYYYPGVPVDRYPGSTELFEAAGFRTAYEAVAMDLDLTAYETPPVVAEAQRRLEEQGWQFGPISPPWYVRAVELCGRFAEDWASAARAALRRPIAPTQLQVATLGEEVGGFALAGGYDEHAERFGPFGVDERLRGKGLGSVLLHRTLAQMAGDGLHTAWFLWTGEHDAAGRLYRRAGFRVTRRFRIYTDDLAPTGAEESR